MTFSIVAFDPKTKDLGVAVESKFPAVGSAVPFARAGVGAIATQSFANTTYGPRGLTLLKRGMSPREALVALVKGDRDGSKRQVGIVDARGRAASYTGKECNAWAGHVIGRGYACQGNILAGERVVESGGYGGFNDRWIDLRVDDHPKPIDELLRVFNVYDMTLLTREDPTNVVRITDEVATFVQRFLAGRAYYKGRTHGRWDADTQKAFEGWMGVENLEEKVRTDGKLWGSVWRYIQEKAGEN
ncbi:MAG: DUF1028 domain-containing protein [Methanobacteriota archaeon]|nr:MAG: DUF1028 domain-containing protein [Euryarchaeota archaeon]